MIPREIARVVARVGGRVQGVGFRFYVQDRAQALGLTGHVRNLRSGEVEVDAEGPRTLLERLVKELREGPPAARVEQVRVDWHAPRGAEGFVIEGTG